jgi:hypothetical protein
MIERLANHSLRLTQRYAGSETYFPTTAVFSSGTFMTDSQSSILAVVQLPRMVVVQ